MSIINQIKTVFLLGLLSALFLWIGSFWNKTGLTIAIVFVLLMNFISYWYSDKLILALYRAKEIKDKEHRLYKIVKEVSERAKIIMPRVYVIPMGFANAFATGRNQKHSAVAVTQGLLNLLDDEELEGVVAHEISHIKNKDILIQSIAATIAGIIAYVAMMMRFAAIFGRDRDKNGLELLILAIVTPIIASLIQLAISRNREFLADESGAKILKKSRGLASALKKISKEVEKKPLALEPETEITAHMFIVNPFSKKGFVRLFMTHPPINERIKRLERIRF